MFADVVHVPSELTAPTQCSGWIVLAALASAAEENSRPASFHAALMTPKLSTAAARCHSAVTGSALLTVSLGTKR